MLNERNLSIGLGVGWFVLADILLRTSSASLSSISVITGVFRDIVQTMTFNSNFRIEGGIALLVMIGWLVLFVIAFVSRMWARFIAISRALAEHLLLQSDTENSRSNRELIVYLFAEGGDSKRPLFWGILQTFATTWLLLLLLQLAAGIISAMYSF